MVEKQGRAGRLQPYDMRWRSSATRTGFSGTPGWRRRWSPCCGHRSSGSPPREAVVELDGERHQLPRAVGPFGPRSAGA